VIEVRYFKFDLAMASKKYQCKYDTILQKGVFKVKYLLKFWKISLNTSKMVQERHNYNEG